MYSYKASIVYGFHGIDKDIGLQILNQELEFKHSRNKYDWLGDGIYFWENNPTRAWQYAKIAKNRKNSAIKVPFVLGAILELGHCLDLLNQEHLDFLAQSHDLLKDLLLTEGKKLPKNTGFSQTDFDFKKRELDCSVIRMAHRYAKSQGVYFDSVRAAFWEGNELYEGAAFNRQNHIQIAILNPNCIKGIFLPRKDVLYQS
jgi:hypothetical protein